jgi:hypothetical protein
MAVVARLVTFVDIDNRVTDARQLSLFVRQEAELVAGRRVLLLSDRGWTLSDLRSPGSRPWRRAGRQARQLG